MSIFSNTGSGAAPDLAEGLRRMIERQRETRDTPDGLPLVLVPHDVPEPVFYICAGDNFCVGSGVGREPRPCPNCGVECVAVNRRAERIEAPQSCDRCGGSLTHNVEAPRVPEAADMFCATCKGPNS